MKKIWLLLLLLLLLIIFCVWSKIGTIHTAPSKSLQTASLPSTAAPIKHYMDYTITQKEKSYTLNGRFSNVQQHSSFSKIFSDNNSQLSIDNIAIDATLLGEESVRLTSTILPHFIQNYNNGKIVYSDNMLRVYGSVKSDEAYRKMQNLLAASTLPTQNNTKVIKNKPIHFSIKKRDKEVEFAGTFNTQAQSEILRVALPSSTLVNLDHAKHHVDKGAIAFTKEILPTFMQHYTSGTIEYKDEVLTISGMVESQEALEKMNQMLVSDKLNIVNHTTIDKEALARAAAHKAKLEAELEAKRLAKERAQKEAEAKRLAEEKAKKEAESKRAQEAKQAQMKKEIATLLKIEHITFYTNKSSLTPKGEETVQKLALILKQYPEIHIEIAGHTDSDGSAIYNQKLSQKRVESVKALLVQKGVDTTRLKAVGYGESKPLVPNTSDANKQKNRRVEINIQGE